MDQEKCEEIEHLQGKYNEFNVHKKIKEVLHLKHKSIHCASKNKHDLQQALKISSNVRNNI